MASSAMKFRSYFRKKYRKYQGKRRNAMLFSTCVFIHIPKTGGSSIEQVLGVYGKLHYPAQEFKKKVGKKKFDNAFTFSFVRNPWDKVVSEYEYRVLTNRSGLKDRHLSFEQWVIHTFEKKDPKYYDYALNFRPQYYWLCDASEKIMVNFVGRFERLQEDFDLVCDKLAIEPVILPRINSSRSDASYRHYYNEKTKNLVYNHYQKDIEYFGYTF